MDRRRLVLFTETLLTQAAPTGLSRRSALKLLLRGTIGGLVAGAVHETVPVLAQETLPQAGETTYLPALVNPATGPNTPPIDDGSGDGEVCSDDPTCFEGDCCLEAAAIDYRWFRTHLVNEILPKWRKAITPAGLFLPHFNRQWQPLNRNFGTLVTQCRLLYNFAQGYALTRDPAYRNAVANGAQFLLDHFRDQRYGGWYWSCGLDGTVRDRYKDSYGHAFVIFGLAHAYQCTGNVALQNAMLQTWEIMTTRFRDGKGGYYRRMSEDFRPSDTNKSQNHIMHIYEALLAAGTVGGQAWLRDQARIVGNFVLSKLVRVGDRRLPEFYDMDWKELPGNADGTGGQLNIGHAFEWAYLASYGTELGLPAWYMNYANSFMTYAMALGYDWQAGGTFSPATPSGQLVHRNKGWWEQTELIRALVHFVLRRRRIDLEPALSKALGFVQNNFIDKTYGGWYQRIGSGIDPQQQDKGGVWKVDYHVVSMCMEAIRLSEAVTTEVTE